MKARRIFSILMFAALAVISTINVQAQNGGVVELKKRIMAEIAAGTHRQAVEPVEAASLATEPSIMKEVSPQASFPKKQALVGTWDVILTAGDGTQVRSTLQVFPGPADGEGSVIHASEFSLAPPSPTLPEQGSWQYTGGTQFVASYYGYSFNEDLSPFGKIGFRHLVTIGANTDVFTGRAVFEVIDLNGQVLFSDTFQTRGVRQRPVAP